VNKKLHLLLILLLLSAASYSQNVSLYEQFNGRYDFTFVGNTLNPVENNLAPVGVCNILTTSSAQLALNPTDRILKAYLYWAGSGTGDLNIKLNGTMVNAQRTFPLAAVNTDERTRNYFSAFADVTNQVQSTGNGTYTVSDLDVTEWATSDLYCSIKTNFAGWVIAVVYENAGLPLNQLNLYDGLEYVPSPTNINISLPSLNVIDNVGAKIGFIAWEGDSNLAVEETLTINGDTLIQLPLNPDGNAFNGTNTVTGLNTLYNMDLDIYDIQDHINIGDQTAEIRLTSGQDFVMINAIITKLNSQLPDATITVQNIIKQCGSRDLTINYTVHNVNSTNFLPTGTTVGIYVNTVLIATTQTRADIPIGGSESGTITIMIPPGAGRNFELLFWADHIRAVTETNENNNTLTLNESLWLQDAPVAQDIHACQTVLGNHRGIFNFSGYAQTLMGAPDDVVTFYTSQTDAQVPRNPISPADAAAFLVTGNPQQIFVRVEDGNGCTVFTSFLLITDDCIFPDATVNAAITQACDSRDVAVTYTVGNYNGFANLQAGATVDIYIGTLLVASGVTTTMLPIGESETATITITIPAGIPDSFELNFIVDGANVIQELVEDNNSTRLYVDLKISPVLVQPANVTACETFNGSRIGSFDFSAYAQSLKNNPTDIVTFHATQQQAENGTDDITTSNAYLSATNGQVFVRLENQEGCYDVKPFTLVLIDCYFPDATVVIEEVFKQCNSRIIHVHYHVSNINGTDVLPAGTPVSVYVNGSFLDYTETLEDLAIGESESNYITLTIPIGIPLDFNLTFVADDTGDGTGIVIEIDENNNNFTLPTTLVLSPVLRQPDDIISCDKGFGSGVFDFSGYADSLKNYPDETITFYRSQQNADQALDPVYNTSQYVTNTNPERIFVRLDNGTCHTTASFLLRTKKCAPITYNYITPNNDNINDGFFVEGLRNIFLNFKMTIYNRWGNLVWTGNHSKADWDGIANVEKVGAEGTTVPTATYYFVLELNDPDFPEPLVGWVYVAR
jgi:gliding motility-associated-like protein